MKKNLNKVSLQRLLRLSLVRVGFFWRAYGDTTFTIGFVFGPSQFLSSNLPQTGLAGPLRTHGSASAEDNVITLHLTSAVAALC